MSVVCCRVHDASMVSSGCDNVSINQCLYVRLSMSKLWCCIATYVHDCVVRLCMFSGEMVCVMLCNNMNWHLFVHWSFVLVLP